LTGVAVNVTAVPVQTAPDGDAAILTAGVRLAFTVIVRGALLAVGEVVQLAFELSTTVTTSPLARVEELNEGLFVPAFDPLILH